MSADKPKWDRSLPGKHPALTPELTEEEKAEIKIAEANALIGTPAQSYMTPEQSFLAQWSAIEKVARGNLEVFFDPNRTVEDRGTKIVKEARTLITALYKLGRTSEALEQAIDYPDLHERITKLHTAIEVDDDLESHTCPRPQTTTEHQGKEVTIELDRRSVIDELFSVKHQQVVKVWQCNVCGDWNASPFTPVRQQIYTEASHAEIDKAHQAGRPVPSQFLAANALKPSGS